MLDHCHILHRGGLLLWTRSFTPAPSPLPSLVRQGLVDERAADSAEQWDADGYAVAWTLANEFGLVFVVAYQRILQLTYTHTLLARIKHLFTTLYAPVLRLIVDAATGSIDVSRLLLAAPFAGRPASAGWGACFDGWDDAFAKLLKDVESLASTRRHPSVQVTSGRGRSDEEASIAQTPTIAVSTATDSEAIARNIAALKARRRKPHDRLGQGKTSRNGTDTESDLSRPATPSKPVKEARKWDDSKISQQAMDALDFSDQPPAESQSTKAGVDQGSMGTFTKTGMYQVADYGPAHVDLKHGAQGKSTGFLSRLATSLGLGSTLAPLTDKQLKPVLASMKEHLMNKNVAKDVADRVCDSVGTSLQGRTIDLSSSGIKVAVNRALEYSLMRILTPQSNTDLLLEIQRKRLNKLASVGGIKGSKGGPGPYTIAFVGVNGVGKSTNLSKVAFWLLQNRIKVLIAACDTFRSGAVEQLRIHVKKLGQLDYTMTGGENARLSDRVELFERGYGKDAAGIAKDAIQYARENEFDVVLIDTAGRMQDNEPLMRALAKLVAVNQPDKIVFVGEALVGNEAVDQLTKFDRSLRDFSGMTCGTSRGVDGMILTKFDTIDDKVGAALSMTYVTGQPILFVGTGQTYTDLKSLRVAHIVAALMSGA